MRIRQRVAEELAMMIPLYKGDDARYERQHAHAQRRCPDDSPGRSLLLASLFQQEGDESQAQPREMKHLSEGIMEVAEGLAPGDAK